MAFTGHRPDRLGGYANDNPVRLRIKRLLETALKSLEPAGCISGMALGVDQWAAETCIKLGIKWVAAVPFPDQEKTWPEVAQKRYRELLAQATKVIVVSPGPYSPKLMQVRNEWMVDRCTILLAVWDGSRGGTGNCVEYAQKVGKDVLRIEPI